MSQRRLSDLRIDADPGVSIVVVDSELTPVAESVGRLEQRLPPGLYGLQFTAGHAFDEAIVRLGGDGLRYRAETIDFATPIPAAFGAAPEGANEAIARISRRPTERIGSGAELLVSVVDDGRLTGANLAAGLSLLNLDGHRIANLAALASTSETDEHPAWAAVCLECDPGAFRLRGATGSLTLEQSLILQKGWQTQVFLDRKSWGGASRRRRASLPDASVAMALQGAGFDPMRADLRLSELARIALLDRRPVINEDDLQDMVYGKTENPMLGLYSAHVILAGYSAAGPRGRTSLPRLTRSLLDEIRHNLRDLLGDHPDVMALDVIAGKSVGPINAPPMLRCSWEALVAASAKQPDLVPVDSLAGRIADQLFGSGVWLTWRKAAPERIYEGNRHEPAPVTTNKSRRSRSSPDLSDSVRRLSEVIGKAGAGSRSGEGSSELSSAAQSALALASAVSREPDSGRLTRFKGDLTDQQVVDALAVPWSVAQLAVGDALDAFGES